ncbi:MAG: hypothetical protein Q8P95_03140 [bacterium]|nr:hypothetical protein [bacterium]
MKILNFFILLSLGFALIYYRERVQSFTGNVGWAEKYLGVGGTFNLYLLLGLLTIIFAFLYLTGTLDSVLQSTFGRFFLIPDES